MKILHVLASNRFSGAENVVCQIMGMFARDERIKMAYCSPDGQIRETLCEKGYEFYPLKKLTKKELLRVVQEYQPDLIHAHDMRASYIAAKLSKNIPFVSHIHNNAFNSRGFSLKSVAYLLAGLKAKHIFWVSKSAFKGYKFHNRLQNKSSILYNVIDIDALYEKMNKDTNSYNYDIVYLGRLTYPKNPQRMIEIVSQVVARRPSTKIAVIGTGDLEEEVKQLSKELRVDKNIDFFGFIGNPLKILYDSKVMIMTSRWEGTPMCALEAMALGVPIVSTPVDGLRDLIVDNKNGFLSGNDNELTKSIIYILEDKVLYNQMKDAQLRYAYTLNDISQYTFEIRRGYGLYE